ncbi:M48 family metalloprotease [Bdellovibrio svalbardensis]|uniref:Peptidase M48 domain-containing protein n=1 Tax=Bdellovibrio svalbardensis TaxID=2972972 RepID=A0ABT6DHA5_9BACT|nr:hypothetical protein [Bdellovibrio svalbardensis]MDG0816247.1 hypothetical protein [Bdellovibrio svalbardensis]
MRHFLFLAILALSSQSHALMNIDQCVDSNQYNVIYQSNFQIMQAGEGRIINGAPVILVNPQLMQNNSPGVNQFILAHECAHHRLGHIVSLTFNNYYPPTFEFDADCLAIKEMRNQNLLNQQIVSQIYQMIGGLMEDASHPAGPRRVQYIQQCLNQP